MVTLILATGYYGLWATLLFVFILKVIMNYITIYQAKYFTQMILMCNKVS